MSEDLADKPNEEPKLRPAERAERTDAVFRQIVAEEKRAEEAKTARLRKARLMRDAENAKRRNSASRSR